MGGITLMNGTSVDSTGSLALLKSVAEIQQIKENFKRNLNLVDGKIRVFDVTTELEMEAFIKLPYEIYKNDPMWPGQNDDEILRYFIPEKSPYASYLEMFPMIAIRDGQVVGRVCAMLNEHYNQHWNTNIGFFGYFECIDDQVVADELLGAVEKKLVECGKEGVYGPINPTIQDVVGVLVDSFDKTPAKGLAYNLSYFGKLIENSGFTKVKDLLHPEVTVEKMGEAFDKRMHKLQPFLDDPNIVVRCFDWENMENDAEILRDLFYNQTFSNHWGYYPTESEEWTKMLDNYRDHVEEDLFLILEDISSNEAIAFALCFKDENFQMVDENGRQVTRQKWDLVGIKPDYHRNGLGTFIAYNLYLSLRAHNIDLLVGSWVLEDNNNSLGLCKSVGMEFTTTYRIYEKKF